jgi:glycosyltransferase involved in cell wall biosynthesis
VLSPAAGQRDGDATGVRALAVFHLSGYGGPQRSLVQAMDWLRGRGSVEFIVPELGPTADTYRPLGPVDAAGHSALTYARGPVAGARALAQLAREARAFRRELRRRRPDLVVVVTTTLPALLIAARLERIPAVVYAAELYGQTWKGAPLLRFWGWLLAGGTALLSSGLVCCSRAVARQFPRRPRRPLAIAYPPIATDYERGSRERGRRRFGLENADPCLVVPGAVTRGRGQDVALRALAIVRRTFPEARLLIVGAPHPRPVDVEFARELRELARALGVEDAVVFAEPTDEMADVYAAADVVVNPARFAEPFGRVAPEALIAGKPVAASRVGALPEVIRDGVDGLLVRPDEPDELAAAVIRLVEDPELATRLVSAGRRRVLEEFGHERDLAGWIAAIESAVSGRRRA